MRKEMSLVLLSILILTTNLMAQQIDIQLSGYGNASTWVNSYGSTTTISLSTRWTAYLDGRAISDAKFYQLIGDTIGWEQEVKNKSLKKKLFWGGLLTMGVGLIVAQGYYESSSDSGSSRTWPGWCNVLMIVGASASSVGLFVGNEQLRPAVYAIREAEKFNKR